MEQFDTTREGKTNMNGNKAKWLRRAAMAGLATGLAAAAIGCVAPPPAPPPPKPSAQVRPIEADAPASAERPAADRPAEARRAMSKATETTRELRVRFRAAAPGAGVLGQVLTARVEGMLLDAGYAVAREGEAEVEAVASVRARERNTRGSRVAWSADADVEVSQAGPTTGRRKAGREPEKVARSWMDVKSGTARGTDEAQKQLAERLAEEIAPFAGEAVRRVGANLRRVEVKVRHAWRGEGEANRYLARFTETVGRLPGVYRCRVASMDETKGMLADVVYDTRAFPEGFLARLKTLPELGLEAAPR